MGYSARLMQPEHCNMGGLTYPSGHNSQTEWHGGGRGPLGAGWKRGAVMAASLFLCTAVIVMSRGEASPTTAAAANSLGDSSLILVDSGAPATPPSGSSSFPPAATLAFSMKHPLSPQSKALQWLQKHPSHQRMQAWRKEQLLALTTMLIANCGDLKRFQPTTKECDWELGFDLACTPDGRVQTWKEPRCEDPEDWSDDYYTLGGDAPPSKLAAYRLPPEIGLLSSLTNLYLPHNDAAGFIPSELGTLTLLTYLGLGMNDMRGNIPSQVGRLTLLTSLLLNDNQLYGSLPSQLGLLTALESFAACDNQITGSIPPFQTMTFLKSLRLESNRLTGSLSQYWGALTDMHSLRLDENRLSGSIPASLGELTLLTGLFLSHNQFSGEIPTQLGALTNLKMGLLLGDNKLTGKIPSQLGALTALEELGLATNQLEGKLPTQLGLLTDLEQFSLHDNTKVAGRIPSQAIANWSNMWILWLYNTAMTGMLPEDICTEWDSKPSLKVDCDGVACPDCSLDWCKCIP